MRYTPFALLALPVLTPASSAQICFQSIRLLPSQPHHLYHVGETVALSPEWAVVGDWAASSFSWTVPGRGALNLYRRDPVGGELIYHEQLRPYDPTPNDWFGWDLDLHGSTLAVGAPGHPLQPNDQAGAVYLYESNGQDWTFSEKVRAPAGITTYRFGAGVDVNTDWLAVRGLQDPEVYIYRRTAAGTVHHTTLVPDPFLVSSSSHPGAHIVRVVGDDLLIAGGGGVRVYSFDATLQSWDPVVERTSLGLGACELAEDGLFFADRDGLRFIPRDDVTGTWGAEELISDGDYFESLAYANGQLGVYGADPASFPFTALAVRAFRRGPTGWRLVGNTRFHEHSTSRCLATDGRSFLIGAPEGGLIEFECGNLGFYECAQTPGNSTGMAGDLGAFGSLTVIDDDVELVASHLPAGSYGLFAASQTLSAGSSPAGSLGTFCVSTGTGYFRGPGQVKRIGPSGEIRLRLDLAALPVPGGTTAVVPGDTWYFQSWYRDRFSAPTSRFTSAISVTFE